MRLDETSLQGDEAITSILPETVQNGTFVQSDDPLWTLGKRRHGSGR